ncbi:MAG: cobalamin B12-binding domain-containing protein [Ferroplasma sp.]
MENGKNQKFIDHPIKVLLAKPAIDGHDRGIFVLAKALRDAGIDVIYAGLLPTPEEVVDTAINEDVDIIALSLLNGAHMTAFKNVMDILKKKGVYDIAVIGGGIIPDEDKPALEKIGVTGNFGPGTPLTVIIDFVKGKAEEIRKMRENEYR